MSELTHLDERGMARMVDVGEKEESLREAVARGSVEMRPETLSAIFAGEMPKGDVIGTARLAGIMAAKRAASLIPLCHPIPITHVAVECRRSPGRSAIDIQAKVRSRSRTGVEMEALTAVSVAALTIYDMCKAVDREMVIRDVRLIEKSGGRSGHFVRAGEDKWD